MSDIQAPIEIDIWDIPAVRHKGRIYRVINSEKVKKGGDYIITGVDSDRYIDVLEEIQWDELYVRDVSSIADIEGLNSLTFIKKLSLVYGAIKKIENLETLMNLEELNLNNNQIRKTSGLDALRNLEILSLNDNQITKVEGLQSLENLRELYLDNNKIIEIDGLELPINLEVLSFRGNNGEVVLENIDNHNKLKVLYK